MIFYFFIFSGQTSKISSETAFGRMGKFWAPGPKGKKFPFPPNETALSGYGKC